GLGTSSTRRKAAASCRTPKQDSGRWFWLRLCCAVLLTCKSLSGGQGYFHREGAKSAKKSDFKNFAFFASSRWIFWVAAMLRCVHRRSILCSFLCALRVFAVNSGSVSPRRRE